MTQDRVLVVEDNYDLRQCFKLVITLGGYHALEASNGIEALDVIRNAPNPPKLIVLDLMMPIMDGWDFLKHRDRDPMLRAIPVVVCSASSDKVPHGVHFLKKPVDLDLLTVVVDQYLTNTNNNQ